MHDHKTHLPHGSNGVTSRTEEACMVRSCLLIASVVLVQVTHLKLGWSPGGELQPLLALCQVEYDLHLAHPLPRPLTSVHFPQQNPKCIYIT